MGVRVVPENFHELVRERIGDARLRRNIERATRTSVEKRALVVGELPDWEQRRVVAGEIRRLVIDHLPAYLDEFARNAEASGARVHWASTAAEAAAIVTGIARPHGTLAVKSKSMVTEEIGLTAALAGVGIKAVETDLGEYIVQLAGQLPSHITAPALHFSRDEVGALFADRLGVPITNDPGELTAIARRVLRRKFLDAGIGISGVNFGVAETGSIAIVENEGNARLSTTLPRVHIAVMGIERVLPDMRSLTHMLGMLARSATGQRISCYTSIITGPRRTGEKDGPDALHIVLVDNGRTAMLADGDLRPALRCIRCGACLNVCPVYRIIGGHGYGSVYSGPIGAVITPVFAGLEAAKALPFASSLCGSCAGVCPVRIELHHLLLQQRARVERAGLTAPLERLGMRLAARVLQSPRLYVMLSSLARTFAPLLANERGAVPVPGWSETRDFPPPAPAGFRQLWKERDHEA